MVRKNFIYIGIVLSLLSPAYSVAQEDSLKKEKRVIEELTYQQQPGLALAASKIFFSEKPWSISGFGEMNFVNHQMAPNVGLGDLEMYYSHLYRFATFFGYRFSKKIIWNSEIQFEHLYDNSGIAGSEIRHTEFVLEAFMDFLIHKNLKARVGFFPLTIGYVNNNDEPVMFYSVNRSEVERIITPSTWIEFGAMFYGEIAKDLNYTLGITQGLNARNYFGATWIRQGREIRLDFPKTISLNPQINYTGIKNTTMSISGYFGESGQGATAINPETNLEQNVKAMIQLYSGYIKYDYKNMRFVTVGTLGQLSDTELLFDLTGGQVIGKKTYGYLFEFGVDLLPYFRKNKTFENKGTWGFEKNEMKLPIFIRYERLDTHAAFSRTLQPMGNPATRGDLSIWTFGLNYNPSDNWVIKANYQLRNNLANPGGEGNLLEFGLGFIF
jgi:hypothetical protein